MCTSCENVVELFATGELAVERSDGLDVHVEERWITRTQAEDLFHRLDLAGFYTVVRPREACAYTSDDGSVVLTVVDGARSRTVALTGNRWACPELDRLSGVIEAIQQLARAQPPMASDDAGVGNKSPVCGGT